MKHARILVPHTKRCSAVRQVRNGWWSTPWGVPEPGTQLVVFGRRTELCIVFGCNAASQPCPARAAIRLDAVSLAVEQNLPKRQRAAP